MTVNTFIMGRRRYQVKAPVVVVQLTTGSETYVYRNGLLPGNADDSHVAHLLDKGMIVELEGTA